MVAKTKNGKSLTIAAPGSKKDNAKFASYDFKGECLRGVYGKIDAGSY